MYLVANTSSKEITIGDMNISIKAKQALNLHKMECRISPESSKDLAFAEKNGYIKVLKKDSKKEIEIAPVPAPIIENKIDTKEIIESLSDIIKQEIKQQMASSKPVDNQDLLKAISNIAAMVQDKVPSNQFVSEQNNYNKETQEESSISEEKMANIHSKAMRKITKRASTSIDHATEEVVDNTFTDNLSELEDLL